MTPHDSPIALLCRALDQTGAILVRVRPEQATLPTPPTPPTPCRSWDVRALVDHVVDELHQFALVTGGGTREQLDSDIIGDDWVGTYRAAADALLAAWRHPDALDRTQRLPVGEGPATWAAGQQITELAVHTWDIARATGQSTDLDPDLRRLALAWETDDLKPQLRGDEAVGHQIGPVVPMPDDAPLYDRVAAFGGRDPT
jgi:uncharacterized protein (TIGR03086 family)